MNWSEYQHAGLVRLALLREQRRELADVDTWLARCGRPPSDPVREEIASLSRHIAALVEQVQEDAKRFAPYRPGVDPWRTQGLRATLRPDFAARGIGTGGQS